MFKRGSTGSLISTEKANDVLELSPKIRVGLSYYNMSIVIIV